MDADQDTVVICVRTFDRPEALRRTIAGVLAQTHQNWILSIFNNGGDLSQVKAIVADFEQQLGDRLVLTSEAAQIHVSEAARRATDAAEGEFIAVHDDDDDWAPEFLERTVAALKSRPGDVAVSTRATVVHEVLGADGSWVESSRDTEAYSWLTAITLETAVMRCPVPPICMLVRRDAWDAVGAHSLDDGYAGDWHALLLLLTKGPMSVLRENLAFYYRRDDSASGALNLSRSGDVRYSDAQMREELLRRRPSPDEPDIAQAILSISALDRENHAMLVDLLDHLRVVRVDVDNSRHRLAFLEDRVERLDPTGRQFWKRLSGRVRHPRD